MLSSTRNEDIFINHNVNDSQFMTRFERPYSESSITCYTSKVELKCLRDPIASRITLVSIFNLMIQYNLVINFVF